MAIRKYINLNDYTLLEDSAKETIYFYPEASILRQKVEQTKDTLYIRFDLEQENTEGLYTMFVTLVNSENEEIYKSYSIYLKETSLYKYILLDSINDFNDADIMPSLIIDFNKLNYNSFLSILSNNKDLSRMIPDLKAALENDAKSIAEAKNIAEIINIQSPINYYQNITGYLINEIESMVANEEEEKISRSILKNFKKNYELVLKNSNQINLSFLVLLANYLGKIRSLNLNAKRILEASELKTDTNKEYITYKDLDDILKSIIEKEKYDKPITGDLNIIQERIVYLIENKPKIKEFKGLLKIILAADKYLGKNTRIRAVDENKLKEVLINSLTNLTYRPLPRNQILIYNLEENVDFIAIISIDKMIELLDTYYINRNTEKEYLDGYKKTVEIIKSETKKDQEYLKLLLINTITMSVYYYKNISPNILLFNKGESIINLDYNEGNYEISIVNKNTNEKQASLSRLTDETKTEIKEKLNKNEKDFTTFINKIIYENLYYDIINQNIEIIINGYNHQDIIINFKKNNKNNSFYGKFTLESLLKTISSIKELTRKPKVVKEEPKEEEEEPEEIVEEGLSEEERNQIIRKASAITEVMNTKPIDNDNYKEIAQIFNEFRKTKNEDLLPTLQELLEKK